RLPIDGGCGRRVDVGEVGVPARRGIDAYDLERVDRAAVTGNQHRPGALARNGERRVPANLRADDQCRTAAGGGGAIQVLVPALRREQIQNAAVRSRSVSGDLTIEVARHQGRLAERWPGQTLHPLEVINLIVLGRILEEERTTIRCEDRLGVLA